MADTILSTIPGAEEGTRLVVVLRSNRPSNPLVLRHESFSEAVGWFVQSEIALSSDQVAGLRGALGHAPASRMPRPQLLSGPFGGEHDPVVLAVPTPHAVSA